MKKKIIALLCTAMMLPMVCINAEHTESNLKEVIDDAIEWKEDNDSPFYAIGTEAADMYIISLKRMGKSYDYAKYLSGLDGVAAAYGAENDASDMQRTAIATAASGGDPRNIGGRDLVADATHYRDVTSPLDKEGVNGFSWALIALDSGDYETPDWAVRDRHEIIAGILSHQNTDGSFDDDVYSTASAITALAPYYETTGAYTITQNQTGWVIDITPKEAIDAAVGYLENTQTKDGDWGDLKSTAMSVIALSSVDVDADEDKRFNAKNGSAIDGLLMYQEKKGGFSADLNDIDGEATSWAICALTSHLRMMQDKTPIFRISAGDSLVFETVAPATAKPSTTVKATTKPKTTTAPKTTISPKASSKPTSTLKPTKTTTPQSPKPSSTPKPVKKVPLVGPIEVPGPMPSVEPVELPESNGEDKASTTNNVGPVIVSIVALLALCGIIAIWYLNKTGKVTVFRKKKKTVETPYKAKSHKKTDERRRFDNRKKFKQRRKFDKRRK
ncbi:MAG: hypothetical protein IJX57_02890 [Clostridia bacterium]|nr:hypothetical protein [Clostridia bacterium]